MARGSLLWKLILAFLLVAVTSAALVAALINVTNAGRLSELIVSQQRASLQSALAEYYAQNGGWGQVAADWGALQFRDRPEPFPNGQGEDPKAVPPAVRAWPPARAQVEDRRNLFGLADAAGVVLVSVTSQYPVGAQVPSQELSRGVPVTFDGQQVGTILTAPLQPRLNPEETLFLQRTNEALLLAAGGAMVVALVLGIILAQTLIRPLRALTGAAQKIAQGQLEQQVSVRSNDEIGQLAQAFNRMSQQVAQGNQLRKQMTADIAHDLRTPLTVIGGYVESMRDGVLKPTPERLAIIYTEIERLQTLVGDLKMLSQVDAGELPLHPQRVNPRELLLHAQAPFEHRAAQQQVRLRVEAAGSLPDVLVDEARMMQVFGNLISNALRYTPSGGEIVLEASEDQGRLHLAVRDNGTGIAPEELPFIFDRFHRADKSRHSESGESGLGLAIVKALVEAHGGSVWAQSAVGLGTTITIELPPA